MQDTAYICVVCFTIEVSFKINSSGDGRDAKLSARNFCTLVSLLS